MLKLWLCEHSGVTRIGTQFCSVCGSIVLQESHSRTWVMEFFFLSMYSDVRSVFLLVEDTRIFADQIFTTDWYRFLWSFCFRLSFIGDFFCYSKSLLFGDLSNSQIIKYSYVLFPIPCDFSEAVCCFFYYIV